MRMGRRLLTLALALGAVTAGSLAVSQAADKPSTDELKGRELAAALGLDLIPPEMYNACKGGVAEIVDQVGVCLDDPSMTEVERWKVAKQLQGKTLTDLDVRIHELQITIDGMPEGPGRGALEEQLFTLLQQREAQRSG